MVGLRNRILDKVQEKLREMGRTYISQYLRTRVGNGRYVWKQYILLRIREGVYVELIRNVHTDLLRFLDKHHLGRQASDSEAFDAPEATSSFPSSTSTSSS